MFKDEKDILLPIRTIIKIINVICKYVTKYQRKNRFEHKKIIYI